MAEKILLNTINMKTVDKVFTSINLIETHARTMREMNDADSVEVVLKTQISLSQASELVTKISVSTLNAEASIRKKGSVKTHEKHLAVYMENSTIRIYLKD
jgi:hypothetical protein